MGLQRGRRQCTWRWKTKYFGEQIFAGLAETIIHREKFWKSLPVSPLTTYLIPTVVIYGNIVFLGQVFCLCSFKQLRERSKILPKSLPNWLFLVVIICITKTHFEVVNFVPLQGYQCLNYTAFISINMS